MEGELNADHVREKFEQSKSRHNIDFCLKEEQISTTVSIFKGRNVLGLLPTGFGKTMCMIIPTIVKGDDSAITLVISPLTSLMDEQMSRLNKYNLTCAKIESFSQMDKDTLSGKCSKPPWLLQVLYYHDYWLSVTKYPILLY